MIFALIAASGWGTRLGRPGGKQFLNISGKPLLWYSVKTFLDMPEINYLLPVINEDEIGKYRKMLALFDKTEKIIGPRYGGKKRTDTVKNGIDYLKNKYSADFDRSVILVHDGARPLIDKKTILRVIKASRKHGAAVCAVKVSDTIKEVEDGLVVNTPSREKLVAAQTPQGFLGKVIYDSYNQISKTNIRFTDDSSVVEFGGKKVAVVEGNLENIKVTTELDLKIVKELLKKEE